MTGRALYECVECGHTRIYGFSEPLEPAYLPLIGCVFYCKGTTSKRHPGFFDQQGNNLSNLKGQYIATPTRHRFVRVTGGYMVTPDDTETDETEAEPITV